MFEFLFLAYVAQDGTMFFWAKKDDKILMVEVHPYDRLMKEAA